MKVLLLTDVPPCHQYTGGLVLNSLVEFLPVDQVAICAVINPKLKLEIPSALNRIPKLLLKKPRESSFKLFPSFLGSMSAYVFELFQDLFVHNKLLPQIVNFAKEQQVDALWVLLEGQTMIRLAKRLSEVLSIPLFTQVCDPFELWLRHNGIDRFTQRRLLAEFDKVIAHSRSCATASWAMSQAYTKKYGVKNQPVIAGLPKILGQFPATSPHVREEFIIGVAGQIYAISEWNSLIQALNETSWTIVNRKIRIRVLSGNFHSSTQNPVNFEYLGWQSQADTIRLLAECDLLYLPYWFSEEFSRETTYCFPSKLVSYFAAGRPVFCHAPAYASPLQYIVQNDAGYLCESLIVQDIIKILESTMTNTKRYAQIAANGSACFFRDFTLERMRESFFQFLGFLPTENVISSYLSKQTHNDEQTEISADSKWRAKVSIIIPVYNGANYLKEAIESALLQTYQNIEIIVINDGSNDNGATEAIALSFGDRIRYFSKPNGGVASALNVGISKMTGDYFSWLSHDDLYVKDKIELQIKTLSKINNDKVVIYSNYSIFTTDPNKDMLQTMKGVPPSEFRYWLTFENRLHGCTLLIPKSAFEEWGFFDENLCTTQDYDLWFRIAQSYQFIHLPENLVKSRSHSEQGSIKMKDIALKECNDLLSYFVKQLSTVEIQQAACCSPGLGYAQLTSSMWYRGFFSAGWTGACLSVKHSLNAPLKEIALGHCILIKGLLLHYIVKPIRKILPPYIRICIKSFLKSVVNLTVPGVSTVKHERYAALEQMDLKDKFTVIYQENMFKGQKSRSGEGSDLLQTAVIRREIPKLFHELQVRSVLDAPCGDWFWMKEMTLNVEHYIGVDIVDALIQKNQNEYSSNQVHFKCVNLVSERLPKVDLIISRDCLVHLSYEESIKIIKNFKASGAKYLLTTTFINRDHNVDLGKGFWRTLNLQLPPFNFPTPLKIINEGCTEGDNQFTDKCLALWRLEDLN